MGGLFHNCLYSSFLIVSSKVHWMLLSLYYFRCSSDNKMCMWTCCNYVSYLKSIKKRHAKEQWRKVAKTRDDGAYTNNIMGLLRKAVTPVVLCICLFPMVFLHKLHRSLSMSIVSYTPFWRSTSYLRWWQVSWQKVCLFYFTASPALILLHQCRFQWLGDWSQCLTMTP